MEIIIAGDFCPRYRGEKIIELGDYESAFGEIQSVVRGADYSIVNLECPISSRTEANPILKMGPNLSCNQNAASALQYMGFNCLTLANNHIMDYGKLGLDETISFCRENGFDYVGVGENDLDAESVLYKEIDGKKLAVINCCEFEFSISGKKSAGANHLDPVKQYYSIHEAKKKADYVIVIVHGGHEHWQLPSPRMVRLYRFFVDAGADAVINHHQHCFSGFETYKEKPIFYGLGNFYFDIKPVQNDSKWNYGYMAKLKFGNEIQFEIIPYMQCYKKPIIKILNYSAIGDQIEHLNSIIKDEEKLQDETYRYYMSQMKESSMVFEPIQNRYTLALQYRRLLPLLRTKKGLLMLYNFILCESHRDKLQFYLTRKISNQ